jgi:hypothetical protein
LNATLTTDTDRDILFADFAAELTAAAHSVALRRGVGGRWLDLQLDLWRVLAEAVKRCGQKQTGGPGSAVRREAFMAELTNTAYRTSVRYGVQGSFRDVLADLERAFRSVLTTRRTRPSLANS